MSVTNTADEWEEHDDKLIAPAIPRLNFGGASVSVIHRLDAIQEYIEAFEYNYTGQTFVPLKRNRGMSHIESAARRLIEVSLPIQCVEAVFLATYLTAGISNIDKVPVSFKSIFEGQVHRHIILAVQYNSMWGSLGISRRDSLMNKPFRFHSLEELIREFEESYKSVYHNLLTVYLGLPMGSDFSSEQPIKWRAMKIRLFRGDPLKVSQRIRFFTQNMYKISEHYRREGVLPSMAISIPHVHEPWLQTLSHDESKDFITTKSRFRHGNESWIPNRRGPSRIPQPIRASGVSKDRKPNLTALNSNTLPGGV